MTFSVTSVYTQGVGQVNEDRLFIGEQRFAVIDGATGLDGFNGTITASAVCEQIANTTQTLYESLVAANKQIATLMQQQVQLETAEIPPSKRSSCGFVLLEMKENRLQFIQTGDCMLFIQYKNGAIREVTYDHLAKLDGLSIAQYNTFLVAHHEQYTDKALLAKDAFESVKPLLIKHRAFVNKKDGYSAYDGTARALDFIDTGNIAIQDVSKILLITDGLQLPIANNAKVTSWLQTATFAFEHGIEALHEEIQRIEQQDPDCIDYPRLKRADDKAGIMITFE